MRVLIERLGHHGDGIAPGPIFVPRTLPGEVVEGEIAGDRMTEARIIEPSPVRIKAPCRHFGGCGGCALQHARDDFVRDWKVEIVRGALEARGLPRPIRRVHTSPPKSRRRAVFSGRRTKKGATVGFHGAASDVIREVPDCLVVRPALSQALPHLAELVTLGGSRKGELRLTVTETETGLDVAVTGGKLLDLAQREALIAVGSKAGFARLTWDDDVLAEFRRPLLTLGRARIVPPPGSFLQATREGEAALLSSVLDAVSGTRDAVIDLFAGIGTFSLPLASDRAVHAVEGVAVMVAALDEGWRRAERLHAVTTETRDLFRRPLLADELSRFGAAVIDPPRAGAEAQTAELARAGLSRIAFVSCNPVTFARDAEILTKSGYSLDWIDVVDQFRWSPHVELAAQFSLD